MKLTIGLLSLLALSGCASWGNSDYGCSGLPGGVTCVGTRDLYDQTEGGTVPQNIGKIPKSLVEHKDSDMDIDSATKRDDGTKVIAKQTITDPVIDTFVTPNIPDKPVPIRTPAQVMRIWVSTWEDVKSGALIAPGYIYTEIEPRKWVIGKTENVASQHGRIFKPLEQSSLKTFNHKP